MVISFSNGEFEFFLSSYFRMSLSPHSHTKRGIIEKIRGMRSKIISKPSQYHKIEVLNGIAEKIAEKIHMLWMTDGITMEEVNYIEEEFFRGLTELWKDKVITKRVYSQIINNYIK